MISIYEIMFSTGDVIAIVVSIIAFVGVIISTIITNITTKRISKSNEELQYILNQRNIDANLVASARIEWIQKVRNTTAELISQYFLIINTLDKGVLTEALLKAKEKTELLILYFGPEDEKEEDINLYNNENNSGKNRYIVEFLVELYSKTDIYYKDVMSDKLIRLETIRKRRLENLSDHLIDWDYEEIETDEGEIIHNRIPILEEEYGEEINKLDEKIRLLEERTKNIEKDLVNLRDIIRIYLKLEWNISKQGR